MSHRTLVLYCSETIDLISSLKAGKQSGQRMFLRFLRGALLLAASAVMVPYTIAVVSNILYGWPRCKRKYRRALSPRKVLKLNYVLFQMLRDKTRFLPLYLQWNKFYRNADPRTLLKNLAFGRNDCTLDVYLPTQQPSPAKKLPVVIFVYGGAWSSGDKSSYGLVCSNIATHVQAVVVCPNYSIYPKGYVDDMIQDIVDGIVWVIDNIEDYGGDKNKLILIGHSAGAHLAIMAVLELLHDERLSVKPSFKFQPAGGGLSITEGHFNKPSMLATRMETLEDSSGSSESFAVVSENGSVWEQGAAGASEMEVAFGLGDSLLEAGDHLARSSQGKELSSRASNEDTDLSSLRQGTSDRGRNSEPRSDGDSGDIKFGDDDDMEHDDDSGDTDSVETVRPKDIERQATLVDMCKSIKAFIGLAGVYSIGDHFQHETMRGIEDVSCMCRAHYGEDHFERFSPKEIVKSLGRCLSLPPMVLAHGVKDYVAPMSSTLTFSDALADISSNVKVKIIPGCDHYEICLDLADRHRKFYSHVMNVILETVAAIS